MQDKDPFAYPLVQYLWVVGLATVAGIIRHLRYVQDFVFTRFVVDILSSGLSGLMTFWLLEMVGVRGPFSAVLIATAGLMGNRAWEEFENLWRIRMGGIAHAVGQGIPKVPTNRIVETKQAGSEPESEVSQ